MKLHLEIENTEQRFRIFVKNQLDKVVYECGWHGGEFEFNGQWYAVFGPYHGLDGDNFRLYSLTPETDPV